MAEAEIFQKLIDYGGGVAIIISLTILLRVIVNLLQLRNGKNGSYETRLSSVEKKVNNDIFHQIEMICTDIRDLRNDVSDLQQRVSKLEIKIFDKPRGLDKEKRSAII